MMSFGNLLMFKENLVTMKLLTALLVYLRLQVELYSMENSIKIVFYIAVQLFICIYISLIKNLTVLLEYIYIAIY